MTGTGDLLARARAVMPGGVSSPVRAFGSVGLDPMFVDRGSGSRIFDTAGRSYIDYVLSWGPLILGHAHPEVVEAVARAARDGTSFGASTRREVELAEQIADRVPSIEMVRFVSSGTEATMSAIRLARAVTSRDLIVKFEGCYHGHADAFLVAAGSGVATLGLPNSPGVPEGVSRDTVAIPFNDPGAVDEAFARYPDRIAAVILEPVIGNAGLIEPREGFLETLRDRCSEHGALLIFDEVMTGFRVARGGAQERYGVSPDLTTLGKVVGGGLPAAAYGGSRRLLERMAPVGPVYQAGTLSGNPLAMAAGLVQLEVLDRGDTLATLEARTASLVSGILEEAGTRGIAATGRAIGSMWGIFFAESRVESYADARRSDTERFGRYYRGCLEEGVFFAPSAFEAGFMSTAHTKTDIDETVAAAGRALDALVETAARGDG